VTVEAPSAPARPAIWPLLLAYLAAFVLAFGASAAYIVVAVLPRATGGPKGVAEAAARFALSTPGVLGSALVDAAALLAVTLVSARVLRTPGSTSTAMLRTGPSRVTPLGVAAAAVGMTGLSLACGSAVELAGVKDEGVMAMIALALASSSPLRILLGLATIAIAPAIAEETFFRGLFQTRLRARLGRWPSIVLTAAAFGIFHVDPIQGSLAFFAGIFFGWLAERAGSIRTGIAAHAFNNAVFVLLASFATPGAHEDRATTAAVLAGGLAALVAAVLVLRSPLGVRA
jgi:membrane protease YdiL (CAAX protease family)